MSGAHDVTLSTPAFPYLDAAEQQGRLAAAARVFTPHTVQGSDGVPLRAL
nr:hypothetical protein [Ramlibacter sp.]